MKLMGALLFLMLSSPVAKAEYRAHEIAIVNSETGTEKRVISTLDHLQYRFYYPLGRNERARLVTSWRCRGRTGFGRPICPPPATQQKANSSS